MTDDRFSKLQAEFPDFPLADLPPIPEGWEDRSWHNEPCPAFATADGRFIVYVDFADPDLREFPEGDRLFSAHLLDDEGSFDRSAEPQAFADWDALLAYVGLRGYALSISRATGLTDPQQLADVEDCMRHVIFHSTLDWQTREEFDKGAREAVQVLDLTTLTTAPDMDGARVFPGHRELVEEVVIRQGQGQLDGYSIHAHAGGFVAGVRVGADWAYLAPTFHAKFPEGQP